MRESQSWKIYECKYKSLDQLVSLIFLLQLRLDSLPGHYFFVDFDCIGYHVLCGYISLANGICYLISIGSLTVRFCLITSS